MINLAVINLKILIKNLLKIIIAIIVIAMIFKFVKVIFYNIKKIDFKNLDSNHNLISENVIISNCFETKECSGIKRILISQLAIFAGAEESTQENLKEKNQIVENITVDINANNSLEEEKIEEQNIAVEEAPKEQSIQNDNNKIISTQVLEEHNKKDVYTDIYNTVQIKNESNYSLTEEMIKPDINYSNQAIIIYHTHTCESYTPTETSQYVASRKL